MKNRWLITLAIIGLMTSSVFAEGKVLNADFTMNSGYVSVDGSKIDGNSITYNEVTYLPVRKISEAFGLSVDFDSSTNVINLTSGSEVKTTNVAPLVSSKKVKDKLQLNSVKIYVNGVYIYSDNIIYQGTTYLPLRKIAEVVGVGVDFNQSTKMINLVKDGAKSSVSTLKPMVDIEDIAIPQEPTTVKDFEKVFLYMANNNLEKIDLYYKPEYNLSFVYNNNIDDNLWTALNNVFYEYTDLFSSVNNLDDSYKNTEKNFVITIELGGEVIDGMSFVEQQKTFETKAKVLNESLKTSGAINSSMTQREIAKVLFKEVTTMVDYDNEAYNTADINPASFTGYGAITNKVAVCQGYTALYNYLLKLNGIQCFGQEGELYKGRVLHLWTVAFLDGEKSYIDTTYGDQAGYTDYGYFDVDKTVLSQDRSGVE